MNYSVDWDGPGERDREDRRIVGVALRSPSGEMWVGAPGRRHHHVISQMRFAQKTAEEVAECEQGFVDDKGTFLTRRQALRVADESGQLNRKPGGYNGPELFSEDLW